MAKTNGASATLPTMERQSKATRKAEAVEVSGVVSSYIVEIPFSTIGGGVIRKRVDCTFNRTQAEQLRQVRAALEAAEAKLANGKLVSSPMHAVQWILEQIADASGKTE